MSRRGTKRSRTGLDTDRVTRSHRLSDSDEEEDEEDEEDDVEGQSRRVASRRVHPRLVSEAELLRSLS
jgi:hypothetical protein